MFGVGASTSMQTTVQLSMWVVLYSQGTALAGAAVRPGFWLLGFCQAGLHGYLRFRDEMMICLCDAVCVCDCSVFLGLTQRCGWPAL